MKCVIAGSRSISNYAIIEQAVKESNFNISTVISGTAIGVDTLGEQYARNYNLSVIRMPAKWNIYGKKAGHIRNAEMAKECDCAIIIWDGVSRGAKNMVLNMQRVRKPYFLYLWIDGNKQVNLESLLEA